jgi:deoxyuridine 5'-triphosphate nucleotidohydrolase
MTTWYVNTENGKETEWTKKFEDFYKPVLQWKPLTKTAKGPQKAHSEDAAWDLFCDTPETPIYIDPGATVIVPTGLAIMPPKGWACDIRGRSGMNSKGKFVILGLVDSFYTGPWGIVVYNGTNNTVIINHHDKIAQFTVQKVWESKLEQVENFDISENTRGTSGFGSSGTK